MAFILSKLAWMFAAPGNFLILLLLLGSFLALAKRESLQHYGRRMCFYVALVLFFIAIFPVGDWLLGPLEDRFPTLKPDHVDGIIVIGSDESPVLTEARGQPVVYGSAGDYLVFATLARKYPNAKLIFAGGSSLVSPNGSRLTNADVARQALLNYGVAVERITFEDKSRNTHENALNAAAIVHPQPQEKWLLVASAFHMPRSMACFRKVGWNVYPAPSNYHTGDKINSELHFNFAGHLDRMTTAVHEYYGLLAYWLMGYINSPWPKP